MGLKDDRSPKTTESPPKELEELSKRLIATLWVNNQLSQLHRVKSSRKIESLKSELTIWLDDPNFIPYQTLLETLRSLEVKSKREIEVLQSELNNRPEREIVKERIIRVVENSEPDVIHTSHPVSKLLLFGMVLNGIIDLIIFKHWYL
jgi:hypothetical protein